MFLLPRQPHLFLLGLLGCTLALPIPALANTPWTEVIEDAAFAPSPAEASAQPTLTLFPKRSATLRYMGLFPATMTLQRQKDQYEITMTATIPFRKMVWRSVGTVVNNQLRPAQFQDIRNEQVYAQTTFDYAKKEIRQGKTKDTPTVTPMTGQALDVFSLAWQLTLNHGVMSQPFQVATGKGEVQSHTPEGIHSERVERATGTEGTVMSLQQISLPNKKNSHYGLAIDVGYLPASFGFEDYALTIEHITVDGKHYGPNGQVMP